MKFNLIIFDWNDTRVVIPFECPDEDGAISFCRFMSDRLYANTDWEERNE